MLVGFHVEGWDHLILKAFLAKILDFSENNMSPEWIDPHGDASGRNDHFILETLPMALVRFCKRSAALAIVGLDNDGNCDLELSGLIEDPLVPRHWNHNGSFNPLCRWCKLQEVINNTRPRLSCLPEKPHADWPIIIAVPVEQIEAWLLTARDILEKSKEIILAENKWRANLKTQFYGKGQPSKKDVKRRAIQLIRQLDSNQIHLLKRHSMSFANFADQIEKAKPVILQGANSNENPN